MEENRSHSDAMATMPYLAALATRYGRAADYRAVSYPSLPNYLAIVGGSTVGITDDKNPASHPLQSDSVFGQLLATGHRAKTYAEAMRTACQLHNVGTYAVRHNPWAYFSSPAERRACLSYNVPAGTPSAGALHDDVAHGALPTFGLLVPDVCNDGHDCSSATADAWLARWVPVLMSGSDYRAGRLAIVITFDEDDHTSANRVLTAVIHPSLTRVRVSTPLTHYSLCASIAALTGRPPLHHAARAHSLLSAFNL